MCKYNKKREKNWLEMNKLNFFKHLLNIYNNICFYTTHVT